MSRLIVTRKRGGRVRIGKGGKITVEILEISRDQVKILIDAPRTIPILREELFLRERPRKGYGWLDSFFFWVKQLLRSISRAFRTMRRRQER